jgi:integrase
VGGKTTVSGVRERNGRIEIDFYYLGMRCRETLPLEPTPKNLKYAAQLRAAILFEINKGNFDYSKYFPNSKKLSILVPADNPMLCRELFNIQLELYKRRYENGNLSKSSIHNYTKEFRAHLMPYFGNMKVAGVTPQDIRRWLYAFNHASKTINNALIPLRKAFKTAIDEGIIKTSPLDDINVADIVKDVSKTKLDVIDPFSDQEKELIINTAEGQLKNLFQFGFWSGLRTGELIALRWQDINFKTGVVSVSKNITLYAEKAPKTKSGIRKVTMLPKAREALTQQFIFTGEYNDFVFHNPSTNKRWLDAGKIRNAWRSVLMKCRVRYRYPYQMRHTYASTLLTNGENLAWIATQMGHVNTEMVIRNYGKFIPDDSLENGYKLKGKY